MKKTNGAIDLDNPFFQDLGTNGRRCVTCHQPSAAWTITPIEVQARFAATRGRDPIFRPNDGSNCEGVSEVGGSRSAAYSMLLAKGLIRVGIDVPADAEFDVLSVDDPHHCGAPLHSVSMYRRPLPSTNLRFLSAVMWDGRESSPTTTILEDLAQQSNDATRGHAQASLDLTMDQRRQIVEFETGLYTAQGRDNGAGNLASRPRRARAVLPQRLRGHTRRRGRLLQRAIRHESERAGEIGSRGIPASVVRPAIFCATWIARDKKPR